MLCCIQKSCSIFLQSIGRPALSMMLSLFRDFILSVPLTLILPRLSGVTMALYSGPIADIISFGAAVLFMCRILRELDRLDDSAGKRADVPGNIQSLEKAGCERTLF